MGRVLFEPGDEFFFDLAGFGQCALVFFFESSLEGALVFFVEDFGRFDGSFDALILVKEHS